MHRYRLIRISTFSDNDQQAPRSRRLFLAAAVTGKRSGIYYMIGKLNEEEIDQLLHQNVLGRLGCSDGAHTYVVPVNYVYDGRSIIGHSLPGKKITIMREHPQVCFEVDEMITLTRWKSVILQGTYLELTEERDRYQAMKEFVDRTLHLKISETALPPELSEMRVHPRAPGNIRPVVFRIIIHEKSGRFEND